MQDNKKIYLLSDPDDWICVVRSVYPDNLRFQDLRFYVLSYVDWHRLSSLNRIFLRGNDFMAVGRPMQVWWNAPFPTKMHIDYSDRPMNDSYPYTLDPLSFEMLPLYMNNASERLETILKSGL